MRTKDQNPDTERRRQWCDRRALPDRRSLERLSHSGSDYDCRAGVPRRQSDLAGELSEGEVWWGSGLF